MLCLKEQAVYSYAVTDFNKTHVCLKFIGSYNEFRICHHVYLHNDIILYAKFSVYNNMKVNLTNPPIYTFG